MITLNGSKFAETEAEFTNSLFETGGTCSGFAKRSKRSIKIMNPQKEKVGMVNAYGVLLLATKRAEGWWYSYGDIKEVGAYDSYSQGISEIEALAIGFDWKGAERHYSFT